MYLFLLSIIIGIIVGLLGNGGDILLFPLLIYYGYNPQEAIAISLFLSIIPSTIPGLYFYYEKGFFNLYPALLILTAMIIGILIGSYIGSNKWLSNKWIYRLYTILLVFSSIYFLINYCEIF